jgi:septum site-determining protein MinD
MDTKSLAGRSFTNIAKRLKGEDVPWLDLTEKDGLFNRLGKIISGGG